jgi:hypothetical protein
VSKPKWKRFRFGYDRGTERVQLRQPDGFDELVLGEHVHLEMMGGTTLWMCVGGRHTTINLRTGKRGPDYT